MSTRDIILASVAGLAVIAAVVFGVGGIGGGETPAEAARRLSGSSASSTRTAVVPEIQQTAERSPSGAPRDGQRLEGQAAPEDTRADKPAETRKTSRKKRSGRRNLPRRNKNKNQMDEELEQEIKDAAAPKIKISVPGKQVQRPGG